MMPPARADWLTPLASGVPMFGWSVGIRAGDAPKGGGGGARLGRRPNVADFIRAAARVEALDGIVPAREGAAEPGPDQASEPVTRTLRNSRHLPERLFKNKLIGISRLCQPCSARNEEAMTIFRSEPIQVVA
jgi:hypothetical protein